MTRWQPTRRARTRPWFSEPGPTCTCCASADRMSAIDRHRLAALIQRERVAYALAHPASKALNQSATHLLGRVPMTWMAKWSGGFPLYLDQARGNRVVDADGHAYVDFALGDTGAM